MQTLTAGTTIASKYGRLGGRVGKMVAPPWAIMAFLIGFPKTGKSAFLQSYEDAFIFNLDCSSTTTETPKAALFPWIGPEGRPTGDDGNPVALDWGEHVLPKINILIELAKNREPRPRLVAFDSLTACVSLLQKYVVKHSVPLGLSREVAAQWRDLHGPAAWDAVYGIVADTMVTLHAHGYGVYIVGHITNAKIPLGEDKYKIQPELTITDRFYSRLFPYFEMVAAVTVREVTEVLEREIKAVIRGVEKVEKRKETINVSKRFLSVDDTDLQGLLGRRVKIPGSIELPPLDAWKTFEKVYLDSAHL
jgi:hypothetical protein